MRRIGFFRTIFPIAKMTPSAGLFESRHFCSSEIKNPNLYLANMAKTPWQEWDKKNMDPAKFIQNIHEWKFYVDDGNNLIQLLRQYAWMIIKSNHSDNIQLNELIKEFAYAILVRSIEIEKTPPFRCCRNERLDDELSRIEWEMVKIKDISPQDKKESFATYYLLQSLFVYVSSMKNRLHKNESESTLNKSFTNIK